MATSASTEGVAGITARWADMALEEEEEAFQPVDASEAVDGGDGVATWPMVGRFLTDKLIKLEYMRQVFASVWKLVKGVQVTELQTNLFMFVFFHSSDLQYVLEEGPWSFENCTLICRPVVDGALPGEVKLDSVDIWVQLHDLPVGYTSTTIQEQIGNFLGNFVKCDERFIGAPWLDFYRIRVALPVDKPLKRRMKLMKRDKTWSWVSFRYERLHNFCYCCGMMGHVHKFCLVAREAGVTADRFPFGPELRAGTRRGPRGVGESWLVPVGGPPRVDSVVGAASGGAGNAAVASQEPDVRESDTGVVAVSKRRREGSGSGVRRHGGTGGDVHMAEVSKNVHGAGSGLYTRRSS
ncbi:uncharacterized protein LOC116023706 [Ipomoea triloba]|uniref:uncharacterized protein LOC116023706 n=1 Tax=Ipomoea triloba TaxID=35885 RepID=UPI00125D8E0C|nr:uncharacterized protein LOC116023706 [Ipomoea triloba]